MKFADDYQKSIINDLIIKSINDSNFKKEFIANPEKVIESSYEFEVHDYIKLVVEDQSDKNTIFLNIPRKIEIDEMELTEEELETVSGGSSFPCGVAAGLVANAVYEFGNGMYDGFTDGK